MTHRQGTPQPLAAGPPPAFTSTTRDGGGPLTGSVRLSQLLGVTTTLLILTAFEATAQQPGLPAPARAPDRPPAFTPPGAAIQQPQKTEGIQLKHEEIVPFTRPEERLVNPRIEDRSGMARADERIWTALILASQGERAKVPPPELASLGRTIEKYFGYKQLELVGSASKPLIDHVEHWLIPSQDFWVSVKPIREPKGTFLLKVKIFHDERSMVETSVRVGPNCPLLVRAPMCSRGQLIIAVEVVP